MNLLANIAEAPLSVNHFRARTKTTSPIERETNLDLRTFGPKARPAPYSRRSPTNIPIKHAPMAADKSTRPAAASDPAERHAISSLRNVPANSASKIPAPPGSAKLARRGSIWVKKPARGSEVLGGGSAELVLTKRTLRPPARIRARHRPSPRSQAESGD